MNFKFTRFIVIVCSLFATQAFAENNPPTLLVGTWITSQSIPRNEIESKDISPYSKYEFLADGTGYFASNNFERGVSFKYKLGGKTLEMFGTLFHIQKLNQNELQLNGAYLITLIKKDRYDSLWGLTESQKHYDSNPTFNGDFHLYDYFFSEFNSPKKFDGTPYYLIKHQVPPNHDVYITANVKIDSTGNVFINKISGSKKIRKSKFKKIKKKIENTSGYWLPATSQGKRISTNIELIFVQRGKSTLLFRDRALQLFQKASSSFERGDYDQAILYTTSAINLDPNKYQFYLFRAVCFLKKEDIDGYCSDVRKGHALNPTINVVNTELINGEAVEIKCK